MVKAGRGTKELVGVGEGPHQPVQGLQRISVVIGNVRGHLKDDHYLRNFSELETC